MNPLDVLRKLEPEFIEAANLAYKMQEGIRAYNKKETGNPAGDIVTEADLAVQEFLLKKMAKTDLVKCRLLAEEDTPTVSLFDGNGNYYLGIDPIDDTAIYAIGGEHFSTIVSLHDGKNILYLFVYFPAWKWLNRIVSGKYSTEGAAPNVSLPTGAEKAIVYWSGDTNPEQTLSPDILNALKNKGLIFQTTKSLAGNSVTLGPFITNKVAGVYHADMNAYDGFVELSIALARGQKIYSGGPNGSLDLTDIRKRELGLYYPGYYLALNESLSNQF
ncbi:MAG TPA: inositol monophosphatase family protein [Candidatus Paceibacterota bacterium]